MVDICERDRGVLAAFDASDPGSHLNKGAVTFTSGSRDLPVTAGSIVESAEAAMTAVQAALDMSLALEARSIPVVGPRPTARRRRSPREIFEDVNSRYPKIMARLAE